MPLNRSDLEAYDYLGVDPKKVAEAKKKGPGAGQQDPGLHVQQFL